MPLSSALISKILFFCGSFKYCQTSEKYVCSLKICLVEYFTEFFSSSDSVEANLAIYFFFDNI